MSAFFGMKRIGILAAGFVLGGAAYAALSSETGRRVCISLVNKGIKLKETVAYSLESMRENVDDIIAEAKEMDSCCCGCDGEEDFS